MTVKKRNDNKERADELMSWRGNNFEKLEITS
jgi:hypothetical protein